jgi:membrane protein
MPRLEGHGTRAEWLAGVFGYVALQVVISRRIEPLGGHVAAGSAQFVLAVAFWWWSLHCLLMGKIAWRRLLAAGLATSVCYAGLGLYITYVASPSVVSSEASFGPIGAVMTLIAAEIGLGVALHVGAIVGATLGHSRDPRAIRSELTAVGRSRPPDLSLARGLGPA